MKKCILFLSAAMLTATLSFGQYFVSSGTSKYVLLEEGEGVWGGYCPDAQQDIMQSILPPAIPKAIVVSWHGGAPSDSMTIPSDPFCTGTGYITGFPMATIDRAVIGTAVGQSRPWETQTAARTALTANFQVDMTSSYNPATRLLTVTVTGKALASLTGDWNLNAYVVEDSVAATGSGYAQASLLNTWTTACNGMTCWFTGLGTTLPAASYSHMNVARKIMAPGGNIWGEIVFTNPVSGSTASRTYTYTVPPAYNASRLKVVGLVQKYGTLTTDRVVENAIMSRVNAMPVSGMTSPADSFTVNTSATCAGADFYVATASYYSGLTIKSEFGDGTIVTNTVLSSTGGGGYVTFSHTYATPGTYTIKHTFIAGTAHLDSVSYSYNYRLCNLLSARFYYDGNSNCTYDGGTPDILFNLPVTVEIDSNGTPVDTMTCISGLYYNAYGMAGDVYAFKVISYGASLVPTCPTSAILYNTLLTSSYVLPSSDFGFGCTTSPGFDLIVNSTTRAYANRLRGQAVVNNAYCTPVTGILKMNFSPKYVYGTATPAPTSISGTELTWNLGSLSMLTSQVVINVSLNYNPSTGLLPTGDTVNTFYFVTPTSGDADGTNNMRHELDTAVGSYDPNYVEVSPSYCLPLGVTELTYTVGFENMGGDTAHNIYVLDTINNNLDFSTIAPIVSSHTMNIYKYTVGGYNIVKFDFPNIKLPDSSHHDVCHGMVQYKVKTKNMTAYGNYIPCRAGIFFDANAVVMTNTTNNQVCDPAKVPLTNKTNTTNIFPNPATDELTIKTDFGMFTSFTITNTVGQQMMMQDITGTQTQVGIKALPAGVYYVTLKGDNGSEVRKFVKM